MNADASDTKRATTIAFVPVRGGSRGIPGKNIKSFCGQPLVYWVLHALQDAGKVDRIVVATDAEEIETVVHSFGFDKVEVFERSKASATDTASTESVMLDFLEAEPLKGDETFMLVQATSPFTTTAQFDAAIEQFHSQLNSGEAESMLSVVRCKRFLWSEAGSPINYDPQARPRRQDMEGFFMENGAFYLNTASKVIQHQNRLSGKVATFELPEFTAVELDEASDWVTAEALMRWHNPKLTEDSQSSTAELALADSIASS